MIIGLGCAREIQPAEALGVIQLSISNVPNDVLCLQITVSDGVRPITRRIDVTPASNLTTMQSALPVGMVSVGVDAFNAACGTVTTESVPTWVSGAVQTTLIASTPVMLTVNMSRPGIATIDIVFPGTAPGSGGATGTGGTGTGGSSGTGGASMATPCTPQGDCTAVLKMDGASSIDPPIVRTGGDGVQGATSIDGVAGPACQVSETNQFHGLPFKERHWQLVGPGVTTGTNYKVTFHVTGVLECKTYQNLTNCPRAVNQGRAAIYDLWCPEGTDPPLTSASDHTNTVMLSVTPLASTTAPNIGPPKGPMPTAGNWWQLNECPQGANEGHTTWKVDYEKSITVPGGSWVNFVEFDTNCREMLNCGPSADSGAVCTEQFSILPPAGSVPAPPLTITQQPPAAGAGAFGQWVYFDVKSITPM